MFWRCNAALVRLDRKKFNQRESLLLPKHEAISFEIALLLLQEILHGFYIDAVADFTPNLYNEIKMQKMRL